MVKLQYLDRPPKVGDVVECIRDWSVHDMPIGALRLVRGIDEYDSVVISDKRSSNSVYSIEYLRVVETKPGSTAKVGDSVISMERIDSTLLYNSVFHNIPKVSGDDIGFKESHSWSASDFLVLCQRSSRIDLSEIYPQSAGD